MRSIQWLVRCPHGTLQTLLSTRAVEQNNKNWFCTSLLRWKKLPNRRNNAFSHPNKNGRFRGQRRHFARGCKLWSNLKCSVLACNVEPPPLKNCKDLTMKLQVKYLFPTSSLGANFYIHQLPEGLRMTYILAHGISMQKNLQPRENIFWIFTDFHEIMGVQSQLAHPHGNSINGFANPEIVYWWA